MPIGGVVITTRPADIKQVTNNLARIAGAEIYGQDDKGNIVAVLDTETSEAMEELIDQINADPLVLGVGLTYLNTEDEAQLMQSGKGVNLPKGFRAKDRNSL